MWAIIAQILSKIVGDLLINLINRPKYTVLQTNTNLPILKEDPNEIVKKYQEMLKLT